MPLSMSETTPSIADGCIAGARRAFVVNLPRDARVYTNST